jgi:hypothetical protein
MIQISEDRTRTDWCVQAEGFTAELRAGRVIVQIDKSRAPPCHRLDCVTCAKLEIDTGEDCEGHDWGNADWPTDDEIATALDVKSVKFSDVAEDLDTCVYVVTK